MTIERERMSRELCESFGYVYQEGEWLGGIHEDEPVYAPLRDALIEARCRVGELEFALNQHLCKYDLADWLACVGHPEGHCEVCAETKPHQHVKATPATDALNQSIRDVTSGKKKIKITHPVRKEGGKN